MNEQCIPRGEEGNIKGNEFERSIGYLLGRLGFVIKEENKSIDCKNKDLHKKNGHGMDIFISRPFPRFPFKIPKNQKIIVSCKCHEGGKVNEDSITELLNTMECYKLEKNERDVGGIIVTTGYFSDGAKKIISQNPAIRGWDLSYIIFLSVLVSNYGNRRFKKIYLFEEDEFYVICEPIFLVHQNIAIFYEGSSRLNREKIGEMIEKFSKKFYSQFGIYTHIEIHSIHGFLRDVSDYFKKYPWIFSGFSIYKLRPKLFVDYAFPWEIILKFDLQYPDYFWRSDKNIKLK